ncbi:hypothetical protein PIB30_039320 [Stylosanthes scabra]|uniref:Uncharacterized protein n=1 Tax=Stylosanthes scabra TaxID=79078 RepID=A0ABU6QED5_9FABA|nr:hypothetical protein [Stylosanthes scabra]
MATTSKVLCRLSCRLNLLSQPKLPKLPSSSSSSSSSLSPSAPRVITRTTSRLPVELGSIGSMMPLHNAVASARLVSSLCTESQTWCLVPQGISMPL